MNVMGLTTRGYLGAVGAAFVIGPSPDIVGVTTEAPIVGRAKLEVPPGPQITGSRETKPAIGARSVEEARPQSPTIIGGGIDKPTIRKK